MKKFLTVALAGVLAASMLFTGCSKKEESKVPDKLIGRNKRRISTIRIYE